MENQDPHRFFHPEDALDRSRRNLPHWDQNGVVAFVTFRLADSIPGQRLAAWENDRRGWLVTRGKSGEGDLKEVLGELDPDERTYYLREFGRRFHELMDEGCGSCV